MNLEKKYPSIISYLDDTDDYENTANEISLGGTRYLVITQKSEFDGGQIIFKFEDENWNVVAADTFPDIFNYDSFTLNRNTLVSCDELDSEGHKNVFEHIKEQVDTFSSIDGPDNGNLACVWAVRHLINEVLGYWVTKSDATWIFNESLKKCYQNQWEESEIEPGGIIISPSEFVQLDDGTERKRTGHVGLLGERDTSGARLIYSNSSSKATWKQNFNLDSWNERYKNTKGLRVLFYPIPTYTKTNTEI